MPGKPMYSKSRTGRHRYIYDGSALGAFSASYLDDLLSEEDAAISFAMIVGKPEAFILADFPGSTLVSQKAVIIGEHPGQEFTLDTQEKLRIVMRLFLVKKRVYILTAVKASDTSRAKFFDSFQVIEPPVDGKGK